MKISKLNSELKFTHYPTIIKKLYLYRCKFYIQTTADAVQRQKHLLLLIALIFGPLLLGLVLALVQPVIDLIYPKSWIENLGVWAIFSALNILWTLFQKKALGGGEGYQYFTLAPMPDLVRFGVEIKFLASLGFLILMPFVISLIYIWSEYAWLYAVLHSLQLMCWMVILLMVQMIVLQENKYLVPLIILTFLPILCLGWLKVQFVGLITSIVVICVMYWQWRLAQRKPTSKFELPKFLQLYTENNLQLSLFKIIIRQVFHPRFLNYRYFMAIISFSSCFTLYWFSIQRDVWEIMSIELEPLKLFNVICALYIAFNLIQVAVIKMDIRSTFGDQDRFWIMQGLQTRQILTAEYRALLGVSIFFCFPVLIWNAFYNSTLSAILVLCLIAIAIPIIQWIYRKPEDIHGVVPLVLLVLWFGLSFLLLF